MCAHEMTKAIVLCKNVKGILDFVPLSYVHTSMHAQLPTFCNFFLFSSYYTNRHTLTTHKSYTRTHIYNIHTNEHDLILFVLKAENCNHFTITRCRCRPLLCWHLTFTVKGNKLSNVCYNYHDDCIKDTKERTQ